MAQQLAKKTADCPTQEPTDCPDGREFPDHSSPALFPMIFLNWIDPPIGFNTSAIDPNNPFYRVRIMNVGQQGGSNSLQIPFAEPVEWTPLSSSPALWQFQMLGVPSEPPTVEYYTTMTVVQGAPGSQVVRSRVFTTPQASPTLPQFVTSASLIDAIPAYIQVSGVVTASGLIVSVVYHHVLITNSTIDPTGPRDLFLQQPW